MKKSFRVRLKKVLYFGTIIPMVCFVLMFMYKYLNINIEAEKTIFDQKYESIENQIHQLYTKKDQLLKTSLPFIHDKALFNSHAKREKYLKELVKKSYASYYYYSDDNITLSNYYGGNILQDKDMFVEDDVVFLSRQNDVRLILGFNKSIFEDSIGQLLTGDYKVALWYKDEPIIDDIKKNIAIGPMQFSNREKYMAKKQIIQGSDLTLALYRDISGEINSFTRTALIVFVVFICYILLMTQVIFFSTKALLKPLNKLIDTVSLTAKEHDFNREIEVPRDEYSEIYDAFNSMLLSVNENIESLKFQSEKITESNLIVQDMNEQLYDSLGQLEESIKQLELYENQSKTLVDHIQDLMWVIDSKGRIIYINNVVSDKLGYDVDALIGVKLENILFPEYKNELAYQEIFYDDCHEIDLKFITKFHEHEEIFLCSTKRIFKHDKLVRIQGVCREITEERYLEVQMDQKNLISKTLNEISEILTRPEKLEFLLKHIVVRIERLLDPLICTIRMVDDKGRLELKAGIGEYYGLVQERFLDIDRDISGRAIKESKIIIVSEKNESDYENYEEVYSIVEKSKEMVFLPLEYDGTTIGVMSIGLRDNLSEADLKILKVFTNQASAAIEKARMYEHIEMNYLNIIKALASTVEAKDAYTENHSVRVSQYARMIAESMDLPENEVANIDIAGLLHDIGKIGISDLILTKSGRLTEDEFSQVKKHPLNGGRIVSEMQLHPDIVEGVLLHHKRYDLKGYPDIDIDSLPLSARIIGVADAFDAMTSNRSYQEEKTFRQALQELKDCSGTQFCPEVVSVMDNVVRKLESMVS
ncbi:HD domain-containing protein [Acidaminobacter sp. JC074]|uniref:HD domain-containing phosphohydrolase n=1 Tax=Acidaminobacter sp. JC074 TaxID=2530199 RepID=UPI001F0CE9F5|nr:HD domain-containing phosphohydrolase [Acidaminobacter sp. JC074]MCH4891086.1 HD domain-containing protein [Acidaminobacter sp. JC074]